MNTQQPLGDEQTTGSAREIGQFKTIDPTMTTRSMNTVRGNVGTTHERIRSTIKPCAGVAAARLIAEVSTGVAARSAGIELTRLARGDRGIAFQTIGEDIREEVAAWTKSEDGREGKGHDGDSVHCSGVVVRRGRSSNRKDRRSTLEGVPWLGSSRPDAES